MSKQAETPRTRQQWYAQEKLLFLQQKMQQTLLQDRQTQQPLQRIHTDLQRYIDLLNTEFFERGDKLRYLGQLQHQLESSTTHTTEIYQVLEDLQQKIIGRQPKLSMTPLKNVSEKKVDRDDDFRGIMLILKVFNFIFLI